MYILSVTKLHQTLRSKWTIKNTFSSHAIEIFFSSSSFLFNDPRDEFQLINIQGYV